MATPQRLVLWDIDRTLLNVSALITEAFLAAAAAILEVDRPEPAPIVGRPESASMLETLVGNGLPEPRARERLPEALRLFTAELKSRAPRFASEGKVLPGVRDVLAALAKDPGSLRANAIEKLSRFGLHLDLDLEAGAFGDDAFTRPELVGIAQERAHRRYGVDFSGAVTTLVGDSPHDVDAAVRTGARLIAVTTGLATADELRAAGASIVLPDLSDTEAVLRHLRSDPILTRSRS
jgi:phosphoglycolate phosphatase